MTTTVETMLRKDRTVAEMAVASYMRTHGNARLGMLYGGLCGGTPDEMRCWGADDLALVLDLARAGFGLIVATAGKVTP